MWKRGREQENYKNRNVEEEIKDGDNHGDGEVKKREMKKWM